MSLVFCIDNTYDSAICARCPNGIVVAWWRVIHVSARSIPAVLIRQIPRARLSLSRQPQPQQ
jgi:hypothetical protein